MKRTIKRETAEGTSKSEEVEKEILHGRSGIPGEQPMEDLCWSTGKEKGGVMAINHSVLTTTTPAPLIVSMKGLSVTCSNKKGAGKESGVKLRPTHPT